MDVVLGQQVCDEGLVLSRNPVGQLAVGQVLAFAFEFGGHEDVDAVGLALHLLVDPAQLLIELLRGVGGTPEYAETARIRHGGHDVAAVAEGEQRKVDAVLLANGSLHVAAPLLNKLIRGPGTRRSPPLPKGRYTGRPTPEMLGVSRHHDHAGRLCNRRNKSVIQRCTLGNRVRSKDACRRQIEGQHPIGEGGKHTILEPSSEDLSLRRARSLLGHHTPLDLGDSHRRHKLIAHRHGRRPRLDRRITTTDPQGGHHVRVEDVSHRSGVRAVTGKRCGSNSISEPSSLLSMSTRVAADCSRA